MPSAKILNGSEILMEVLLEQGVSVVFGYPGGAVLNIYDALYKYQRKIRHIMPVDECGACHAADGYARTSGRTGVVIATSGPGATNLVTPLATAYMDSVPLVAITGNVQTYLMGKDSFQEVYIAGITMPITKHNFIVRDVKDLAKILRKAFIIANSGRKGPVLVDIPKDISGAKCEYIAPKKQKTQEKVALRGFVGDSLLDENGDFVGKNEDFGKDFENKKSQKIHAKSSKKSSLQAKNAKNQNSKIDRQNGEINAQSDIFKGKKVKTSEKIHENHDFSTCIKLAAQMIKNAKKPIVYFGGGAKDAGESLLKLAKRAQMPCVHTIMAAGTLSDDEDLNIGLLGMHGKVCTNRLLREADLILAIGTRFSDRVALNTQEFGAGAQKIHIDIDYSEINKNVLVDLALIGDLKDILGAICKNLKDFKPKTKWAQHAVKSKLDEAKKGRKSDDFTPQNIFEFIANETHEAIYTTDVGQHQMWAVQYLRHKKPRSFLTSGGLGTMGFGYGAALGAQLAAPKRPVVHITGDGSFLMNLNEVATAVECDLPIISVILNNCTLGMVRQWQKAFYDSRFSSTNIDKKVDFVAVARGFGAAGFSCKSLSEFKTAFKQAYAWALKHKKPVWVECCIDKDLRVLPMIPAGGTFEDIIIE